MCSSPASKFKNNGDEVISDGFKWRKNGYNYKIIKIIIIQKKLDFSNLSIFSEIIKNFFEEFFIIFLDRLE